MTKEEKQKAINALKISAPLMVVTQEEFKDYIHTLNQVMDWLEQEPSTKVNQDLTKNKSEIPTGSTTRNCIGCKYSKDNHNAGTEECHLCMWENQYTPTTKNDLAVDCVSRQFMYDLGATCIATRNGNGELIALGAIEELPSATLQEPRWIPVSERLPDTDDEVLCWYEYYHWSQGKVLPEYELGRYFKETKTWFGEVANGKDVRVIAWMPLPEPFEPQESEIRNETIS